MKRMVHDEDEAKSQLETETVHSEVFVADQFRL